MFHALLMSWYKHRNWQRESEFSETLPGARSSAILPSGNRVTSMLIREHQRCVTIGGHERIQCPAVIDLLACKVRIESLNPLTWCRSATKLRQPILRNAALRFLDFKIQLDISQTRSTTAILYFAQIIVISLPSARQWPNPQGAQTLYLTCGIDSRSRRTMESMWYIYFSSSSVDKC